MYPWVMTAKNNKVHLLETEPASINILDIAVHLSKLCRFVGAGTCISFYSVAQHSLFVTQKMGEVLHESRMPDCEKNIWALKALLHDAHEAYMGDIASPVKVAIQQIAQTEYSPVKALENLLSDSIADALGVPKDIDMPVLYTATMKELDARAMLTEAIALGLDITDFTLAKQFKPYAVESLYEFQRTSSAQDIMTIQMDFLARFRSLKERIAKCRTNHPQ